MRKLYTYLTFVVLLASTSLLRAQYCAPSFFNGCIFGDQVENFYTTGGSTNITNMASGCSAGSYVYNSTMSCTQLQGQDITLNMQSGSTYGQGFKVWVDWNNNNSFADAGELVYTSPGSSTALNTGTITVPYSASAGTHRMRVLCNYAGIPAAVDGCPVGQTYGECEDYDFIVVAATACSGTPTAGTAVCTISTTCPSVNYTLSLTGATMASGLTYQWQSATSASGPWSNIAAGTTPSFITSQLVDTWYRCIVACSGNSATSSVVSVTTTPFLDCYCNSAATAAIYDEEIFNVTVNGSSTNSLYSNTNGCSTAAPGPGSILGGYSNFKTMPSLTTMALTQTVSFTIAQDECDGAPYYGNGIGIWIDYNHNGSFLDAGENVFVEQTTTVGPRTVTGSFTVPLTALSGNTVMRIVCAEGYSATSWTPISPCLSYGYGETEDYMITIGAPPTCPQPTNLSLIQANNSTAQLQWTAGGSETQWQLEYGPQGFTPGTGTTLIVNSNPYTLTGLTTNSFYSAFIQGICSPGDTSYSSNTVSWNTYNQGQYIDWNTECPTAGFEDISGFGTNANLNDDAEVGITLPFPVLYQGALYTNMTIGDNGGVIFGTTTGQVGYAMPASGNGLFPYNEDNWTNGNPGQAVYYGQVGNAPTAKFIVQWNNVPHYTWPAPTNGATYQLVIEQATNEIYFVYDDVDMGNAGWDYGADAEIGVRGAHNVDVSMNSATYLQNNSCVHFYYTNCPHPSNFATSYVAPDEAMITWNAGMANETNWTIIYGPAGFNPATAGTTVTSTTNSAVLTGLSQLTAYDVYIYADCAVGLQSAALNGSFTTPPFCANPTNLFASTTVDSLMSSWSWTAYSAQYPSTSFNLQLVAPGAALYTGALYNLDNNQTDTTYDSEFMAGQTFDVYVQAVCGQDTSFYVGPFTIVFPLTNDTICGAQHIPVNGQTYVFNNTGASFDLNEQAIVPPATGAQTTTGWANQNLELTTWFEFTAPASGSVRVNCTGVNYNGQAAVYSAASCSNIPSFQLAAANDDAIGGTSVAPNFTVCGLTPGNTYYMMHDGFDFTAGNYSISIYEIVLNAGVEGEVLDLCYGDTANLFLGIANYQLGGTWTQTTPTLGLNNNLFNTLGLAAALYQFTYTVQDGCASDAAHAYVQLYNAPNAGVGSTLNACLNEPINLLDGLSGIVDMTGSWSTAAGPIASPAITTSNTGGSYNYTYTASNGVCPDETATVVVVVDAGCDYTAGIGNTEFVYEVYPNPTSGQLTIVVPANTSAQVRLTDLNGKTLLDIQSQTAATVLDLGQFATGVYMLQIQVGSNRVTERIIKQ